MQTLISKTPRKNKNHRIKLKFFLEIMQKDSIAEEKD